MKKIGLFVFKLSQVKCKIKEYKNRAHTHIHKHERAHVPDQNYFCCCCFLLLFLYLKLEYKTKKVILIFLLKKILFYICLWELFIYFLYLREHSQHIHYTNSNSIKYIWSWVLKFFFLNTRIKQWLSGFFYSWKKSYPRLN